MNSNFRFTALTVGHGCGSKWWVAMREFIRTLIYANGEFLIVRRRANYMLVPNTYIHMLFDRAENAFTKTELYYSK